MATVFGIIAVSGAVSCTLSGGVTKLYSKQKGEVPPPQSNYGLLSDSKDLPAPFTRGHDLGSEGGSVGNVIGLSFGKTWLTLEDT